MARVTMHGLVQWRAKKHQPDRPWDLWVSISVSAVCHQAEPTFLVETKLFLQISLTFCVVWQATQLCNGYFLSFFNVAEGVDD
jgi:hypothetical protein